ncbi:hypothetical protein [Enteroscipio rubneri]|uniref:Uncharacterized protein n=1 Tax=Enteroscipio rubneri TaxID=2070686 RepID=A0A2K2U8Q5_9ACTN|nr:hypothetical protein [Enteroscipio rubneri]PNV66701.1 hypothetical protein C2L71_11795 [Enteroscipio rubneri]
MSEATTGLFGASDFERDEPGCDGAVLHALSLIDQSAGMALVCAGAIERAAEGCGSCDCQLADMACIVSRLLRKCGGDLAAAVRLID